MIIHAKSYGSFRWCKVRGAVGVLLLTLAMGLVAGLAVGLATVLVEAPLAARLLVVDTDAGADDAFALLELLLAERTPLPGVAPIVVLAITTVQGNAGVENVTRNVFAVLESIGRKDVPVFAGAGHALLPPKPTYTDYFGEDGFGDFLRPGQPLGQPQPEHAAVALVRLAKEHAGDLTLVCIGPLTNIALAMRLDPGFLDNLQDVYILGGAAYGNGNANPGVEFNMKSDPEAALVVFDAVSRPVYVLPWETVIDSELPLRWRREVLGAAETKAVRLLNLAERVALAQSSDSWTCADGLLAAHVLTGSALSARRLVRMSVLGGPGPGRGVSLVDHSNTTGLPGNTILLEKPDVTAFQRLLLRLLAGYASVVTS